MQDMGPTRALGTCDTHLADCEVQDLCLCSHGRTGRCNTAGTRIPSAGLTAPQQPAGEGHPGHCTPQRRRAMAGVGALAELACPGTALAQGRARQALPNAQVGLNGLLAPREL